MKIAFVDDNEQEIELFKKCLISFFIEKQYDISIDYYKNGESFLEHFTKDAYSLIFMDIYMEELNGIETTRKLREKDPDVLLIFLTSQMDYMPDAFSCHAFDYIEKPATKERIDKVLADALMRLPSTELFLSFTHNRKQYKLLYSQILYIISDSHRTNVYSTDNTQYTPYINFSTLIKPLEKDPRFLLINKGILVNLDYVKDFENDSCILKNNTSLPVRKKSVSQTERIWREYTFKQLRKKQRTEV